MATLEEMNAQKNAAVLAAIAAAKSTYKATGDSNASALASTAAYNKVISTPSQPTQSYTNPYNPILQPGSYSNYQNTHPNATPMPKEVAYSQVAPEQYNPYNPILQPGSYTNYQNTHPTAITMPQDVAKQQVLDTPIAPPSIKISQNIPLQSAAIPPPSNNNNNPISNQSYNISSPTLKVGEYEIINKYYLGDNYTKQLVSQGYSVEQALTQQLKNAPTAKQQTYYNNQLQQALFSNIQAASAYHHASIKSNLPQAPNPFMNASDISLAIAKGTGGKDKYMPDTSASSVIGLLPGGKSVQDTDWDNAINRDRGNNTNNSVDFTKAVSVLDKALSTKDTGIYSNVSAFSDVFGTLSLQDQQDISKHAAKNKSSKKPELMDPFIGSNLSAFSEVMGYGKNYVIPQSSSQKLSEKVVASGVKLTDEQKYAIDTAYNMGSMASKDYFQKGESIQSTQPVENYGLQAPFVSKNALPPQEKPQGFVSYDKTNSFMGMKYPAIEFRNPITVGKEAVTDITSAFDDLFGYNRKGGYLSKTPDPIGSWQHVSTALGRATTLNLPDLETNEPAKKYINENAWRILVPLPLQNIPQVKTYFEKGAGKDISTTLGTAGRTVYSDTRSDPLTALTYLYGARAFKGAQYGIESQIAKGAVSSSPIWNTAAKALSTPTASTISKAAQLGVLGYTGVSAYKDIQSAPNTPEGKGEAIGHVATPLIIMTAGLPLAARYKPPTINNPYAGKGFISGKEEKSVFGKISDSAVNAVLGKPNSVNKGIPTQSTRFSIDTPTKTKPTVGNIQKAPTSVINEVLNTPTKSRFADIYDYPTKTKPTVGNIQKAPKTVINDVLNTQSNSRFGGIYDYPTTGVTSKITIKTPTRSIDIGIPYTKTYKIPGINRYITKEQAIKAGIITTAVIGGTTLGYLYGDKIVEGINKIKKSPYAPVLSGGLIVAGMGTKLRFAEKLKPTYDKNLFKYDKDLSMWRLLTIEEKTAWDLKQLGLTTPKLITNEKINSNSNSVWRLIRPTEKTSDLKFIFGNSNNTNNKSPKEKYGFDLIFNNPSQPSTIPKTPNNPNKEKYGFDLIFNNPSQPSTPPKTPNSTKNLYNKNLGLNLRFADPEVDGSPPILVPPITAKNTQKKLKLITSQPLDPPSFTWIDYFETPPKEEEEPLEYLNLIFGKPIKQNKPLKEEIKQKNKEYLNLIFGKPPYIYDKPSSSKTGSKNKFGFDLIFNRPPGKPTKITPPPNKPKLTVKVPPPPSDKPKPKTPEKPYIVTKSQPVRTQVFIPLGFDKSHMKKETIRKVIKPAHWEYGKVATPKSALSFMFGTSTGVSHKKKITYIPKTKKTQKTNKSIVSSGLFKWEV